VERHEPGEALAQGRRRPLVPWAPARRPRLPIALDPTAEDEGFLVADTTGGGQVTFSTFHSPPGPYVGMQAAAGDNYLCYGLSDPGTDRFAIQIAHG
jgi:hypothetical protein